MIVYLIESFQIKHDIHNNNNKGAKSSQLSRFSEQLKNIFLSNSDERLYSMFILTVLLKVTQVSFENIYMKM